MPKNKMILVGMLILSLIVLIFVGVYVMGGEREATVQEPTEQVLEDTNLPEEEPEEVETEPLAILNPVENIDALIVNNFEDESLSGWGARMGGEIVKVTDETARTGEFSLRVTGRTAAFNGPALETIGTMVANERYEISVWVKLLPGQSPTQMVLSAQRTTGGAQSFDNIARGITAVSENWVQLQGVYQFGSDVESLQLYIETVEGNQSFFVDDFVVVHLPTKEVQQDIPSLRDVFADYFTIGAAVELKHLEGQNLEMLNKHYNLLVAENLMKPISIQPIEGTFNFTQADRIVEFAEKNNMKLRFHALVWHNQVPDWFFIDPNGKRMSLETDPVKREENKELLLNRMENHIRVVVERYRDVVDYWEVVNEVIDPSRPNGMRESEWYKITGKEFIRRAFQVTREVAGEEALLAINDYNSHNPTKRDFLFDLVMELRNEGIRVDIIGHQTHINIHYPPMSQIDESIVKFAEAGFRNHITELDISVYEYGVLNIRFDEVPEVLLDALAIRYRDLFDIFRNRQNYIDDVTFWGVADNHTWLHNRPVPRRDAPFLFDEKFQAKEAFWAVVDPDWSPR